MLRKAEAVKMMRAEMRLLSQEVDSRLCPSLSCIPREK
jgi:hypothetical protein